MSLRKSPALTHALLEACGRNARKCSGYRARLRDVAHRKRSIGVRARTKSKSVPYEKTCVAGSHDVIENKTGWLKFGNFVLACISLILYKLTGAEVVI
jgi:hypothetical protein